MTQILIKLIRIEQTTEGALGALKLEGEYFCSFLQPDNKDSKRFQIPAGTYFCRRFHGIEHPNTFEIVVMGHTALLFHAGNTKEDTIGCTILGQYPGKLKGDRAVLNSGKTFEQFMDKLTPYNEFYVEIIDSY